MHISMQKQTPFSWVGEGTYNSSYKRQKRLHYTSFLLDDEEFEIGDFVLIRNDDSVDPEDPLNCYVAQIKELFETDDDVEPHQAKVQWYSRASELPQHIQKSFGKLYTYEIVEEHRKNFNDTIDADTIFNKCEVKLMSVTADFEALEENCENNLFTFFCRYKFTSARLHPVFKDKSMAETPSSKDSFFPHLKSKALEKKKKSPSHKTRYCIVPNESDYPKVVLKKIDDRVLESKNGNVRILVADQTAKTIEDVTEILKKNLILNSPRSSPRKRPLIHSLCPSIKDRTKEDLYEASNYNGCLAESETISVELSTPIKRKPSFNTVSAKLDSPSKRKQESIADNIHAKLGTPTKRKQEYISDTIPDKLSTPTKRKQEPISNTTPAKLGSPSKRTQEPISNTILAKLGTPTKRIKEPISNTIPAKFGSPSKRTQEPIPNTIPSKLGTPTKRIQEPIYNNIPAKLGTPSKRKQEPGPTVVENIDTLSRKKQNSVIDHNPVRSSKKKLEFDVKSRSRSCSKSRTNTPRSCKSPTVSTPKAKLVSQDAQTTPRSSGRLDSLRKKLTSFKMADDSPKAIKTPVSMKKADLCTPSKKTRTAKRTIKFEPDPSLQKSPSTRMTKSGRKVRAVNYFHPDSYSSDEDCKKSMRSDSVKSTKLAKFIRANYSEDSDSDCVFFTHESSESSSEDDETAQEKFKQSPKMSKRRSVKKTPKSCAKKLVNLTIPERKTPLKPAQNILEESRMRLHVSAVPKSLPCREEEFSDIYSFVSGCLCAHTGGCMYISGVPGTGKTATVHEVIQRLEEEKEYGDVPNFTFVEVNGMWMTDPYQCYVHIFKALTGKTIASQQAANLLEKRFTENGPKKEAVVLLVDELDRLWTRKQTVMYNIFDWPSKIHSKLVVVAIANTMDLPERLMMNRISSRLGLTRKTFHPYNFRQLQEIIMSRIQELKVFDPDAVQFVARKVAAVSGDARRALDICRHATEMAERSQSSPKKKQKILVSMEHVDEAIQQMFSSPVIAAIKSSSKLTKLFFEGMLSEFTRTGSEETTLFKVSSHVRACCQFEGLPVPKSTQISNICHALAASHLILVDNFQNDIYMKIRLSVSPDDVSYALTGKEVH